MCKASVVIPYYRKKQYLKKTIQSVLNQSFKKFEIIIIYDDVSKDDLNFVKNIKKLDKRIKLYVNKKNMGAGLSRNFGISKSKGKYIVL